VPCDVACAYGYQVDANGCNTCTCNPKPTICPAIACLVNCVYGKTADPTGCPSCVCNPCPEVLCSKYCEYGYAPSANGCPNCTCADQPICPLQFFCNLNCTKGLSLSNGCPTCLCNSEVACTCALPAPTPNPKLCPDGKTYATVTTTCARTTDNQCYYYEVKCPLGFKIVIAPGANLSDTDIALITAFIVSADNTEITINKTIDPVTNDTVIYIYIQRDLIPSNKTAVDLNNDITASIVSSGYGQDAVSYVVDDGSGSLSTTTPSTGTGTGTGTGTQRGDVSKLILSTLLYVLLMLFI